MVLAGLCILIVYLIFKSLISRLPAWSKPRLLVLYLPSSSRNILPYISGLVKINPVLGQKYLRIEVAGDSSLSLEEQQKLNSQSVITLEEASLPTQNPTLSQLLSTKSTSPSIQTIRKLVVSCAYFQSKEERAGWPRLRRLLQTA